jgi:hypothetical protein
MPLSDLPITECRYSSDFIPVSPEIKESGASINELSLSVSDMRDKSPKGLSLSIPGVPSLTTQILERLCIASLPIFRPSSTAPPRMLSDAPIARSRYKGSRKMCRGENPLPEVKAEFRKILDIVCKVAAKIIC